jgi:hypothetical protein
MYQINGKRFKIRLVDSHSGILRRSDGSRTIGVCDNSCQTIYIADNLTDAQFQKCLIHEICHSAMFAYGINLSVEQEEIVCDIMSRFGHEIIGTADEIFYRLRRVAS